MSRPIDADDLPNRKFVGVATWTPTEADSWQRGWNDAIDTIVKVQPTIDAVPVVRCGECQWWDAVEGTKIGYCLANSHGVNEDWYCADGERKEKE